PLMEQYVFTNDVQQLLSNRELSVDFYKVGNFMTSLEMQGLSLTLLYLENDFYIEALKAPVTTISW
ncbi:dihydroxyacetone kinase, partial [Listeria monocytogenes]|nr:dihydroxyacetone kinase [Listeria monocytogenes]